MAKSRKLDPADFPNLHANHRGRMRARILRNGAGSLEQHELLETLLFLPITRQNTNHAAHMLVERFGGVEQALNRSPHELTQVHGIGEQAARFLCDMGRVIEAYALAKRRGRMVLTDSALARRLALEFFAENPEAECVMFSLDESMRLLSMNKLPRSLSTQALITAAAKSRAAYAVIALRGDGDGMAPHDESEVFKSLSVLFSLLNVGFVDLLVTEGGGCRSYLEQSRSVDCVGYDENVRMDESSLHFAGSQEARHFYGAREDEFDDEEAHDDDFSDSEIDPEEILETVVEPLGTVAQIGEAEMVGVYAAPFTDIITDTAADESPF